MSEMGSHSLVSQDYKLYSRSESSGIRSEISCAATSPSWIYNGWTTSEHTQESCPLNVGKVVTSALTNIFQSVDGLHFFQMVNEPSLMNDSYMHIGMEVGRLRRPRQYDHVVFPQLFKHCTSCLRMRPL